MKAILCLIMTVLISSCNCQSSSNKLRTDYENIAVCVTGQSTRLELESKIKNFIIPNAKRGKRMHLFLTLYNSSQVFGVNFQAKRVPSPHALYFEKNNSLVLDYLGVFEIVNWVTPKGNTYVQDSIQHAVARSNGVLFDLTVNLHPNAEGFSKVDLELAKLGNEAHSTNPDKMYAREKAHMSQWINIRKCMQLVEQVEIHDKFHFDSVIKMRDDSFFFTPMVLPSDHADYFSTLSCFFWWGINDSFFVIGRRWASCLLRGFSEEYYLRHHKLHKGTKKFRGNPEHWVDFHSRRCEARHRTLSMCQMPVLPMMYTGKEGGFTPNGNQYYFRNEAFAKKYKRHDVSVGYCFDKKNPCPDTEKVVRKYFDVTK